MGRGIRVSKQGADHALKEGGRRRAERRGARLPAATLDQPAADGVRTAPAAQSMGEQAWEKGKVGLTCKPRRG